MTDLSKTYKPVTGIWLTLGVIVIMSLIYPVSFAYIDRDMRWVRLGREFWFTPTRLIGIMLLTYGILRLGNWVAPSYPNHWLRHVLQIGVLLPLTVAWLYAYLIWIDLPFSCGTCQPNTTTWEFRRYMGVYSLGALFIYGFMSGLNFYRQAQMKAAETARLEKECAQVCLQALRNQVNPHFLFNSLSVLSTLVQQDPVLSEKFILQLSKAYRYILDQKDLLQVSLQEELDFLTAYCFLLEIRFGGKVRMEKQVGVDTSAWSLPPLTLQLLVENAVKHNRMSAQVPLVLQLEAAGDKLRLCNNLSPREQHETSTGIGLENIRKRFLYLTSEPVLIEKTETTFCVTVPLVPKPR
ncbi:MAG: histidine kinase [Chitinophagaceae bacterium]|nr:histidine kinase [Chitinophagaceae bacterium]